VDGQRIGTVTSAIHSPRLEKNIALAMVAREHADIGTGMIVKMVGESRNCEVVPKPFYDPNKSIASSN
jgi:aminomethyltransferase